MLFWWLLLYQVVSTVSFEVIVDTIIIENGFVTSVGMLDTHIHYLDQLIGLSWSKVKRTIDVNKGELHFVKELDLLFSV